MYLLYIIIWYCDELLFMVIFLNSNASFNDYVRLQNCRNWEMEFRARFFEGWGRRGTQITQPPCTSSYVCWQMQLSHMYLLYIIIWYCDELLFMVIFLNSNASFNDYVRLQNWRNWEMESRARLFEGWGRRGTQIMQPPCNSSYVRWRFFTTQTVLKTIMLVPTHSETLPRALYRHLFYYPLVHLYALESYHARA